MTLAQVPNSIWPLGGPNVRFDFFFIKIIIIHFTVPDGWYYLGPAANSGSNDAYGVIVKELVPYTLGQVSDWVQVWNNTGKNNAGTDKETNFSLWVGVPENPNHVVLGGVFVRSHNKPTIDESRGIRTIDKDLLIKVKAAPEIWIDRGSKATADGAVWGISTVGHLQAINPGAFIPVKGFNNPPAEVYALDSTKVSIVEVCLCVYRARVKEVLIHFLPQ
jgi:hypothetical protein